MLHSSKRPRSSSPECHNFAQAQTEQLYRCRRSTQRFVACAAIDENSGGGGTNAFTGVILLSRHAADPRFFVLQPAPNRGRIDNKAAWSSLSWLKHSRTKTLTTVACTRQSSVHRLKKPERARVQTDPCVYSGVRKCNKHVRMHIC